MSLPTVPQSPSPKFDRKKWHHDYFLNNKASINAQRRERYKNSPELRAKCAAELKKKTARGCWKGRYAASGKEWRIKNHKHCLAAEQKRRDFYKSAALEMLGSKCCRCGFSDSRALQIDHINGAKEGQSSYERSGFTLYRAIVNRGRDITTLQLLCANCNWIKRFENGEHNAAYKLRDDGAYLLSEAKSREIPAQLCLDL